MLYTIEFIIYIYDTYIYMYCMYINIYITLHYNIYGLYDIDISW